MPTPNDLDSRIDAAQRTWDHAGSVKKRWLVAALAFSLGFLLGAYLL